MIDFDNPVGQIDAESALTLFEKSHQDLLANQERIRVANELLLIETKGRALEQLTRDEMASALAATGKRTRQWFGMDKPKAAVATPQSEDYSDVIVEMRKARGQAA